MAGIVVTLVSEQAAPNIRFLKEFRKDADLFIFLSTEEMEQHRKTQYLCSALNISRKKTITLKIPAYRIDQIEEKLLDLELDEHDHYFVNITGGTKPMSIATLSFFTAFDNARIYYLPIGKEEYQRIYPRPLEAYTFQRKITLREYVSSYGLKIISREDTPSRRIEVAQRLMEKVLATANPADIPEITEAQQRENTADREYFGGRWFEEYVYWTIKEGLGLKKNEIAYQLKVKKEASENEFDVMFIHQDELVLIECKAFYGSANLKQKTEEAFYRLAALENDFGISARTVFMTTLDMKKQNDKEYQTLKKRAKSRNIVFLQKQDLFGNGFLKKIVKEG